MKWSVGTKLGLSFAVALTMLVVLGVMAFRSITKLIAATDRVAQTYQVQHQLGELRFLLNEAQSGQRGYIITGAERFLEPYHAAIQAIAPELRALRALTDDAALHRHVDVLERLSTNLLVLLRDTIDLYQRAGFEAAQQRVLAGQGKATMDELRRVLTDMAGEAQALLHTRNASVQAQAYTALALIWYGIPSAFVVLALIGLYLRRNIARPLDDISQVAARMATGDLSLSVPAYQRRDEVGVLVNTFSHMLQYQRAMVRMAEQLAAGDLTVAMQPQAEHDALGHAIATMVTNLRRMNRQALEAINVLASSTSQILATTSQIGSSAAETATAVSQTTTTVEEVKQTAQVSTQKSRSVSESAQKAVQIAQHGRQAVGDTTAAMGHIQAQMTTTADSIIRLSEQNQAIGEIVATVNDLAEQSNLLSVNAAIEAARAGEQGKGFVVVAEEIRSLAAQSKQATTQVRAILNDVQRAISAAVLATEHVSKTIETGVQQAAAAGEAIRLLADSITDSAQAAIQIVASSQQQSIGMDQVALAMEHIKQASTQNVAGIKQMEIATHDLHELGQQLQQLVAHYKV